jgi:hypothetical protein
MRRASAILAAALLSGLAACGDGPRHLPSTGELPNNRLIGNDIEEVRRPASMDSRPVQPNVAPPISNAGTSPRFPTE